LTLSNPIWASIGNPNTAWNRWSKTVISVRIPIPSVRPDDPIAPLVLNVKKMDIEVRSSHSNSKKFSLSVDSQPNRGEK
jgi:hypothetical protein